jgi:hypothetical protein
MTDRPTKISFGEMRHCADYRCSHSVAISGPATRVSRLSLSRLYKQPYGRVRGLATASFWIVGLGQSRRRRRNRDHSRNESGIMRRCHRRSGKGCGPKPGALPALYRWANMAPPSKRGNAAGLSI